MMRLSTWLAVLSVAALLWHDCGGDFGVFCYRIGLDVFTNFRSRVLVPVPVREAASQFATRNNSECSTPSFISSTRCITQKDSRS